MKKLKILVFEYISGGGLSKSELPASLASEGKLMLQALIDNLVCLETIEPVIMLDYRMVGKISHQNGNFKSIQADQSYFHEFLQLMATCDAVWPIAPESDSILAILSEAVQRSGKILLNSSLNAVLVAGNKWLTYECLTQHSIATIETQKLADFNFSTGEWIIKPVDGVGGIDSIIVNNQQELEKKLAIIEKQNFIIQPHIQGEKISLSCLFYNGRGWLICANRQQFELINQQYHLIGLTVNFTPDISKYHSTVNAIANAIPGLWGYVGIDLIVTSSQVFVLEINPRLTSSFAGIYQALGINCAKAVIDLLSGEPRLEPACNRPVNINILQKECHDS